MAQTKNKPEPIIADRAGDHCVLVQLQEKRRNARGRLIFRKSKSLTIYNITVEELEAKLRAALK